MKEIVKIDEETKNLLKSLEKKEYSITAIDGYLRNADVWLDLNHNGKKDILEPSSVTGKNGLAILTLDTDINPEDYSVYVKAKRYITFDEQLNKYITNDFLLFAPKGENIITPLTTLVELKIQEGNSKFIAIQKVADILDKPYFNILKDFIKDKNTEIQGIAEDLVRLEMIPNSSSIKDTKDIFKDINKYIQLKSNSIEHKVIRNSDKELVLGDKIDSDDIRENEGISAEENNQPDIIVVKPNNQSIHYDLDLIKLSEVKYKYISSNEWKYFKFKSTRKILLNVELSELNKDVDLYVKKNERPSKFNYDCRSNNAGNLDESCLQELEKDSDYFIGVYARKSSFFKLLLTEKEIKINKVVLLLHGLASNPSTWTNLINDDSFFNRSCISLKAGKDKAYIPKINSDGIYCYNVIFGSDDKKLKGLDNKRCNNINGCSGDYSSFKTLAKEIDLVIKNIIDNLGTNTEILLLGHSRGGLAGREFLQSDDSSYKKYVKSLVTTGTPHQGSPLGRFYTYMNEKCVPKSLYQNDNGICEDNWEVIKFFAGERWYFPKSSMDLQSPSIKLMSPESESIIELNNNLYLLKNIKIGELSYSMTSFGVLTSGRIDYDLYKYRRQLGDHPHPSTLTAVEKGETRDYYKGDGIVPVYSQELSRLLKKEFRTVDVYLHNTKDSVIHTEETKRITDLKNVMNNIYKDIGWINND